MNADDDFDAFLGAAWQAHAEDPSGVADRLSRDGPAQVREPAHVASLAHLVHHVFGEHLGRWADGRAVLARLAALPACDATGAAAVARATASLHLSEPDADGEAALAGLAPADRIRATAMAAANLAGRDTRRAAVLFRRALAAAEDAAPAAGDPLARAVAIMSNNLAATLEETSGRSEAERELMIDAATAARRWWALAGTWLETGRAEYRLAMTWLQAGDPARARDHARAALALADANGRPALEVFFANEALARAARAAGDAAAQRGAAHAAELAFKDLSAADRDAFGPALDALRG